MRERAGALIDRVQALAARHARLIGWLSTAWLVLIGLSHAGFFALPRIAFLESRLAMYVGVAWNAAWWAIIRPKLERRRLRAADQAALDNA